MPLYEGIGLISEKHAVVIDIGSAYTKCGFAGEIAPRCIIPTYIYDDRSKQNVKISNYRSEDHLYYLLTEFLRKLYFKFLLVNPKDRRVVIVESVFYPLIIRETLAKVLFIYYEVSSVLFAPSHLMALYTLGISNGLVVDIGYKECLVLPIYEGTVMLYNSEDSEIGSKNIHSSLKDKLLKVGRLTVSEANVNDAALLNDILTEEVVEDIKVRTCFVTPIERVQKLGSTEIKSPNDVLYPVPGATSITIPGTVREETMEYVFEQDCEDKSLPNLILNAIQRCPIDMRRTLAENIVLIGGTSMIPGFKHRLLLELKARVHNNKYKKVAGNNFKFHELPGKENYIAWLGASIFGATDAVTLRSLTRDQYIQKGFLPDWSNNNTAKNEERTY